MKTKKLEKKKSQPKTRRSATKKKLTNAEWLRAGGGAFKGIICDDIADTCD